MKIIDKFLKYWKPKALITIESEIWPNMIVMTHNYCKNVSIINGKIILKQNINILLILGDINKNKYIIINNSNI